MQFKTVICLNKNDGLGLANGIKLGSFRLDY
jgi:hypothetical protein